MATADMRDDPMIEIAKSKEEAFEGNFLGTKSNITKRFADWAGMVWTRSEGWKCVQTSRPSVCDEFLLAAVDFVAAHFRIVELRRKMKVCLGKEIEADDTEGKKEVIDRLLTELGSLNRQLDEAQNEIARMTMERSHQRDTLKDKIPSLKTSIQKIETWLSSNDAWEGAEQTKKETLEALGQRYAEVLRANLAVKFSQTTKPFDETAFYEAVYKFVSAVIRKFTINQKTLCPQHMWKELDVELGLVFRGGDFNLEKRGLVKDPNKIGAWLPSRTKRTYRKINVHAAISRRSPAVAMVYKEAAPVAGQAEPSTQPAPSSKRPSSAPVRRGSSQRPTQAPAREPDISQGRVPFVSSGRVQMMEAEVTLPRQSLFTLGVLNESVLEARQGVQRSRPSTATVRGSGRGAASMGPDRNLRPSSAKTERTRPLSATNRPISATKRGVTSSKAKRPFSAQTARPASARTRHVGMFQLDGTPVKPWAAHEHWRPSASQG